MYRYGDRYQLTLLPPSIEDYVGLNDPVRAYDAFIEALNLNELGIVINPDKVGNPSYNPKAMLKLLVYGPSYGVRSSRKLERAIKHNMSFIWLMGGLTPDHKTIAEFRKNNKAALKKVLKQCVQLCISLGLIEGNTLFVDGTKIRANASIKNSWTKERCQEFLKTIDERIDKTLSECEAQDAEEENQPSLVTMDDELKDKVKLKAKVEKILNELNETNKKSINTTDTNCNRMNSIHGSYAGYNTQVVVDEKHGLIVHADAVDDNNDCKQLANQINQANSVLEKKCSNACADSGYNSTSELNEIDKQNINVIVPSKQQAAKKDKPFGKNNFRYDKENDNYICPEGNILKYSSTNKDGDKSYIMSKNVCLCCSYFGICTKIKNGRVILRLKDEELKEKFEADYQKPCSQEIYKLRKQKVELPFAHLRHNLGIRNFLLRGISGVKAEIALLSTCFNLRRMMSILGVIGLISRLTG